MNNHNEHARLATIQAIRTQIKQIIDQAKETHNASH